MWGLRSQPVSKWADMESWGLGALLAVLSKGLHNSGFVGDDTTQSPVF